jgi:hypothetical protein
MLQEEVEDRINEVRRECPEFECIINEVIRSNREYWYETWADIKPKLKTIVGWWCENRKFASHVYYDAAQVFLESLSNGK